MHAHKAQDDAAPHASYPRLRTSSASSPQAKSPPPDLPSLMLDARIVYLGMPLVSAVTELIIAELLYLQYKDRCVLINASMRVQSILASAIMPVLIVLLKAHGYCG